MSAEDDENLPLTLPFSQFKVSGESNHSDSMDESSPLEKYKLAWGYLYPVDYKCNSQQLTEDEYTLGRANTCQINVTEFGLEKKIVDCISKQHFKITRERIKGSNNIEDIVIYIEDLSQNGTFVNKNKVGKGRRVVLENNDVISVAQAKFAVYIFMNVQGYEGHDLPPEIKQKYAVSRKLGSGACGEVKLVFTKVGCKRFAMKIISKKGLTMNNTQGIDPKKIMNEVEILKKLRHPCVIRTDEIFNTIHSVYIVLELMEGGELFDRIRQTQCGLSDKNAKLIFYQVALAVQYLHSEGITHRDLKPENILLASDKDVTLVKVSDFGLSKFVDAETMMKTFCGTMMYVAPEILLTHGRGAYTSKVDVWSLGVILYTCLSALTPFSNSNAKVSLYEQITQGAYDFPSARFAKVDTRAKELIKGMMTLDPNKRVTIDQVLRHKWLLDQTIRGTVYELFNSCGDLQNFAPYLQTQINAMRLPPRAPLLLANKRPRLEFLDKR
ncbi:ovarian-specific serine/threonine-protein kinase Lok isoform X2 [Belonocnema kinseyi]|uniref:ovarian-specific serine/threonine-protein kinase Lok isoform X2 n=1 Tax=Belonocnema kinseyi TaxID=2817044 RepID=UPI00143CF927|nr:ovarian-specific serine/threonine-protein kinase Lok isoform X2 [Belonocnema kinseyi]